MVDQFEQKKRNSRGRKVWSATNKSWTTFYSSQQHLDSNNVTANNSTIYYSLKTSCTLKTPGVIIDNEACFIVIEKKKEDKALGCLKM